MKSGIAEKKKLQTRFGEISMDKSHKYSQGQSSVKISPFLVEKMVYVGQLTNYQEGVSLLETFYGISISQTQHFRLTNQYGALCSDILARERKSKILSENEIVYSQCDGCMILTREKGKDSKDGCWQEVKLCRVFTSSQELKSGKRGWIGASEYVGHIGSHKEFKEKAENLIDPYESLGERLVFISDGAPWIHQWQKDTYPKSIHILDYYHACEHLSDFAQIAIREEELRKAWLQKRKTELLDSDLSSVISCIKKAAKNKSHTVIKEKEKLLNYFQTNKDRMDYKTYQKKGLHIGSGAIEAAHRTVIQKRMKQSGQRWTRKRAQNVLNLRACYMSGHWSEVIELIRKSAA